jgi:hypothetical protein
MNVTADIVIVGIVVAGALLWAVRAAYRTWKSQGACSSCGSSGDCPVAKNPKLLEDLTSGKSTEFTSCQQVADTVTNESTRS